MLEMGPTGSAACLGRKGELGVLAPGSCADLVAWPLEGVAFAGAWSDPVQAWIRCGRDGNLVLPKLNEMLETHGRIARSWQGIAI